MIETIETIKFSGIYVVDDSTLLQVSCERIAGISDYIGTKQEKINDLIDDHLKYVNNWSGTPDFSFSDRELSEINRLDNYILAYKNDKGNYVRVSETLEELEYIKELLQERDELTLKTAKDYCFNSDIEKFIARIKRIR
jgi:hypothetical protein